MTWYSVFTSLCSAVASASVASLSTYSTLSLLADVFICLSFSLYWATALSLRLGGVESCHFLQLSQLLYCSPCIWGDPFGLAGICASVCLFHRYHHCSVEIVNGQGRFILEDAEEVHERDVELLHDACVLHLRKVTCLSAKFACSKFIYSVGKISDEKTEKIGTKLNG